VVSFKPRPPYPRGKSPRLGGPQSRSGRRGEKTLGPTGTQTPTPRSSSPQPPVAIPTALSRRIHNNDNDYNISNSMFQHAYSSFNRSDGTKFGEKGMPETRTWTLLHLYFYINSKKLCCSTFNAALIPGTSVTYILALPSV
jgi:hypothetical protein